MADINIKGVTKVEKVEHEGQDEFQALNAPAIKVLRVAPNGHGRTNGTSPDREHIAQIINQRVLDLARNFGLVRSVVSDLRDELHQFIHDNLTPIEPIGFTERKVYGAGIEQLTGSITRATATLERIYQTDFDGTTQSLMLRRMSHQVQAQLEEILFLIYRGDDFNGNSTPIVRMSIGLKSFLQDVVDKIDSGQVQDEHEA